MRKALYAVTLASAFAQCLTSTVELDESCSLPTTMQALVATAPSSFEVQQAAQVPALGDLHKRFKALPSSCEVLVAVNFSSINPADLRAAGPFPQVMGSDLSGVIIAEGKNCERLHLGDRVWGDIGAVVQPASGGKGKENGAYAAVAVALESQLGQLPQKLGFREGAALPKVALTSYKALTWYGGAPYRSDNGTILVLGGSGGCGSTGIQLAKALGATEIITTTSAANAAYVTGLGATRVIDYHKEDWWKELLDASIDVIYDTVGQSGTGDRAMAKLRSGGFYVTITGAMPLLHHRSDVHSSMFINSATNLDNFKLLDTLHDFVQAGKLRMSPLKTYQLDSILDAFAESKAGHVVGKLVIEMPERQDECQVSV